MLSSACGVTLMGVANYLNLRTVLILRKYLIFFSYERLTEQIKHELRVLLSSF